MSKFQGSVQIRTKDREPVLRLLHEVATGAARFYCGPVIDGWVGVYPSDAGQDEGVGRSIAKRLGFETFTLIVHHDDVLYYRYYKKAALVDSYCSLPGFLSEADRGAEAAQVGDPTKYAHLLKGSPERVRQVLARRRPDEFVMECDRLRRFALLLGIVNSVTSYEELRAGERRGIHGWREFVHVPSLDAEEDAARRATPRFQYDIPPTELKPNPNHGYVHAIEEDRARGRLLFGGSDGIVRSVPLSGGAVAMVLERPEPAAVLQLVRTRRLAPPPRQPRSAPPTKGKAATSSPRSLEPEQTGRLSESIASIKQLPLRALAYSMGGGRVRFFSRGCVARPTAAVESPFARRPTRPSTPRGRGGPRRPTREKNRARPPFEPPHRSSLEPHRGIIRTWRSL